MKRIMKMKTMMIYMIGMVVLEILQKNIMQQLPTHHGYHMLYLFFITNHGPSGAFTFITIWSYNNLKVQYKTHIISTLSEAIQYNEYFVKTHQLTVVWKRNCVMEWWRCTVQNLMIWLDSYKTVICIELLCFNRFKDDLPGSVKILSIPDFRYS